MSITNNNLNTLGSYTQVELDYIWDTLEDETYPEPFPTGVMVSADEKHRWMMVGDLSVIKHSNEDWAYMLPLINFL